MDRCETFSFYFERWCCFFFERGERRWKHEISKNKNKHNNRTCDQIRSSCIYVLVSIFIFRSLFFLFVGCHFFIRQPSRRRCIFFLWLTTDSLGMWSSAFATLFLQAPVAVMQQNRVHVSAILILEEEYSVWIVGVFEGNFGTSSVYKGQFNIFCLWEKTQCIRKKKLRNGDFCDIFLFWWKNSKIVKNRDR